MLAITYSMKKGIKVAEWGTPNKSLSERNVTKPGSFNCQDELRLRSRFIDMLR
jgi:hypothetical protein